jgi:hypothetical protein
LGGILERSTDTAYGSGWLAALLDYFLYMPFAKNSEKKLASGISPIGQFSSASLSLTDSANP